MDACAEARRRGCRLLLSWLRHLMTPAMLLRHSGIFLLLALLIASVITPAQAAMSLSRTRLIITAKEREATIDSRNEGQSPILLQTWVDDETDPEASRPNAESLPVPFITDPPMFRIDPNASRQIRVLLVQPPANLPTTQESLFWFNAYETPTRPPGDSENESYIQFAFHVRIKLFYRPAALADYTLTDAHKLRFTLSRNEAGEATLHIRNPAPIHQSISALALTHNDERIEFENAPMLAPNSELQLLLPSPPPSAASGMRVVYSTINDHGSLVEDEQAL